MTLDVAIPTCDRCGAEWIDDTTAKAIDQSLDAAYRTELSRRAVGVIKALSPYITNPALEQLLGLSHGYLSKLKSGDRIPSPELVAELGQLARQPVRRLEELREYWDMPMRRAG